MSVPQTTVDDFQEAGALTRFWVGVQRRFGRQRLRTIGLGSIPFLAIIALWGVNDYFDLLPRWAMPSMWEVIEVFHRKQKSCPGLMDILALSNACDMTTHILSSIGRMVLAAVIGIPLGVILGMLAGMNRPLSKLLEPIAIFFNSISGIAWIPLAIVWFGVGWVTTLFIILNTVVWLMFFNTMLGVRGVARVYEQSVMTMGGRRWEVIRDVYFPGAMPSIITGMRMSMGFGWRALIAAEMIGGDSGLGFMIFTGAAEFQMEVVLLGVILISVIWMITDRLILAPLEKWTIERWGLVWKPT